jgi:hypothetical protein
MTRFKGLLACARRGCLPTDHYEATGFRAVRRAEVVAEYLDISEARLGEHVLDLAARVDLVTKTKGAGRAIPQ